MAKLTFDDITRKIGKIPTPRKITCDGTPTMTVDGLAIRVDVYTTIFEDLKDQFKRVVSIT